MPVTEAEIRAARSRAALAHGDHGFGVCSTRAEVLGFLIAEMRAYGADECHAVELVIRAGDRTGDLRSELEALEARGAEDWRIADARRRLDWETGYRAKSLAETEVIMRRLGYRAVADRLAELIAEIDKTG